MRYIHWKQVLLHVVPFLVEDTKLEMQQLQFYRSLLEDWIVKGTSQGGRMAFWAGRHSPMSQVPSPAIGDGVELDHT